MNKPRTCPEYDANNDHSCLFHMDDKGNYTRHLVFSRRITNTEWVQFSRNVDKAAWDSGTMDWDVKRMADVMREVTGDPDIIKSGEA